MVQEPAIIATGYHVPARAVKSWDEGFGKLPEGVKEVSIAAFDEDATTMAVEAARWALESAGIDGADLAALLAVSGSDIDAEVASAGLNIASGAEGVEEVQSAYLLHEAFERAREAGYIMAVASHLPSYAGEDPLESGLGAGAAAFLLGPKEGVRLEAFQSLDGPNRSEEALKALRDEVDGEADLVVASGSSTAVGELVGDVGVASVPLDLVESLSRAIEDQRIAAVFDGEESSTALGLHVDVAPAGPGAVAREIAANRTYLDRERYEALRDQRATSSASTSMGAYISPAAYSEQLDARFRLVGHKCVECGAIAFNPRALCMQCGSTEFEDAPLRPTGSVYATTSIGQGGAPTEFAPLQAAHGPYGVAVVELDDGPRLTAMLTDCDPEAVAIGDPIRAAFRRIYTQDGITRYGMKFRPRMVEGQGTH